jgi:NAD(P)H-dependent nitrite reductase small subunit
MSAPQASWTRICPLEELPDGEGVCALIGARQIALFRIAEAIYALDNFDPAGGANVLSRGILGEVHGERVIASPLYKHHYSLATGRCLEDASASVNVYPARIEQGAIWVEVEPPRPQYARRLRLVVVGNGMAGMRTLEQLLDLAPGAHEITVFGAEGHPGYNRLLLTRLLAGERRPEDIVLHRREWYEHHRVTLYAADPVVAIDRRRRVVRAASGREQPYDRLLLATGARPNVLPIPGAQLSGVVHFHELADVETLLATARSGARAAVIGGGLLGLEAAHALAQRGLKVTVVHLLETLMERQLDPAAATLLRAALESHGIAFLMSARTTAITGLERATGLKFANGSKLPAELVVMAVGSHPNIELAVRTGLRCERGVLVDDTMQTWDPSIYAVGECVQHRDTTFGLLAPLMEQARVCAAQLAEVGVSRYRSPPPAATLHLGGLEVYSAGDPRLDERCEALELRDHRRGIYKRLVIRDNRLCSAVLYGDVRHGPWYRELMASGRDVAALREQLLAGPPAS